MVALVCACPVSAAPWDYEGKEVAEVRFDPELQPIPAAERALLVAIAPGQTLTISAVQGALQRLYATGRYDELQADATLRDGKVILTFFTKQNWFISRITVEGANEPPNREQMIGATKLELGSRYSEERMTEAIEGLRALLRSNGFYSPRIQPLVERYPEFDELHVQFLVNAGDRAYFARPVIAGNPQLAEKLLVNATRWKRWWGLLGWNPVTEARVQQGVERVRRTYLKRDYLLAKVELKELQFDRYENTVSPLLKIEAGPKVRVSASGAKLSKGKIKDLVPVYQEQSVDQDLLEEGVRKITQHFQAQGYFDTEVEYERKNVSAAEQAIEYSVSRGDRYKVVSVEVKGNSYFDTLTVRERMGTIPAGRIVERYGRYSDDLLSRDKNAIEELYRSNGFRDVLVTPEVVYNFQGKDRLVGVVINIKEGEQVYVNSLDISGVDLRLYEYVKSRVTSGEGQPYSAFNLATDRDNILNFYYANGYPDATMEIASTPSKQNARRMDVQFQVREGRRQFVQDVEVNGLSATRPALVNSRIRLRPGNPLSLSSMVFSQRRLYDLGIFAKVDMALQNPQGSTREKRVLYQLEEASRYSVNGGIGAEFGRFGGSTNTLSGAAGQSAFAPRVSLGVSRLNFLGLGHTVSLQGRLSTIESRVVLSYLAPQFQDRQNLNLSLTALYDTSRNVRTFNSRRLEGALQVAQRFTRAFYVQYRYVVRRVSTDEVKIEPGLIPLFSQPVRVGLLATTLVNDRRDDPLNATRGSYTSIDLSFANKVLYSETAFGRVLARNSSYHRIGRDLVLSRNTTFGYIGNYGDVDIPLPERFFAGGAVSHRGFPENQAGPRDPQTGFPIGGRALFFNQTELRIPFLRNNLGGVLFHDAGNIYSRIGDISLRARQRSDSDFDYMVHAIGIGFRYRTPIGPIRLDFAYGLNSPRFFGYQGSINDLLNNLGSAVHQRVNPFQFHFSLGQAF